jgi:4-amino-4-deoxychorismate lyase
VGCSRLNIQPVAETKLLEEAARLVKSIERGVIKIIITRGQGGRGYATPKDNNSSRIITLYPWPDYAHENSLSGVQTRVCDYRYAINPGLAGIKHLNRLEQILARSEWEESSIAEGIVMDQNDNVIEGTMSNIFYVTESVLLTPDLSSSGINGVVRQKIIELAATMQLEVRITKTPLDALMSADEIFMCNSIIGVWPIKMIDEKPFQVGETTHQIRQSLEKYQSIPTLC